MGNVLFKYWIQAARPKTLLVSMAPVIMSVAFASVYMQIKWLPALICLVFAVLAQILSNFVNDYADGVKGIDADRIGPQRMVASGIISPAKMRKGIMLVGTVAFLIGCTLIYWGGWVLLPIGIVILLVALAYSTGPFPLSQHGFGDLAVIIFYGVIPVTLTFFIQTGMINLNIVLAGFAIGFVSDNLLIVNNMRDADNDLANGKKTTVGIFGKRFMTLVYHANQLIAIILGFVFFYHIVSPMTWLMASIPFLAYSIMVSCKFSKAKGLEYNKLIGLSSLEAIIFALTVVIIIILKYYV